MFSDSFWLLLLPLLWCKSHLRETMLLYSLPWLLVLTISSTTTTVVGEMTAQPCVTTDQCVPPPIGTVTCYSGICYTCPDAGTVPYPIDSMVCTSVCDAANGAAQCQALLGNAGAICAPPNAWGIGTGNGYNTFNGAPSYKDAGGNAPVIKGFCSPCSNVLDDISEDGKTCLSAAPPVITPSSPPPPTPPIAASPPPMTSTPPKILLSPPPSPGAVQSCNTTADCKWKDGGAGTVTCFKGVCVVCAGDDKVYFDIPGSPKCIQGCGSAYSKRSDKSCAAINSLEPYCWPLKGLGPPNVTLVNAKDGAGKSVTFRGYCKACPNSTQEPNEDYTGCITKKKESEMRITWKLVGIGAGAVVVAAIVIILLSLCLESVGTTEEDGPQTITAGVNPRSGGGPTPGYNAYTHEFPLPRKTVHV